MQFLLIQQPDQPLLEKINIIIINFERAYQNSHTLEQKKSLLKGINLN